MNRAWETAASEFAAMEEAWLTIATRAQRDVASWTHAIEAVTAEHERLRREGLWVRGPDDAFGVLGIGRAEIRHSAMIRWLFDPIARHGLGDRFLRAFLRDVADLDLAESLDDADARCEVARASCRADIVVWSQRRDLTLIIEAKVDAEEGQGQCDYLYEQFNREPGAIFVFLAPRRRAPVTASGAAAAAFRSADFGQVRTALEQALRDTAARDGGPGRRVAEDYVRTLRREFS